MFIKITSRCYQVFVPAWESNAYAFQVPPTHVWYARAPGFAGVILYKIPIVRNREAGPG